MAKRRVKMPSGIRQGLAQAQALGNQMSKEARADYAIALNANAAGAANLRAMLRSQAGVLRGTMGASNAALGSQFGGAARTAARPSQMVGHVQNKYGGALAGYAREASAPAARIAEQQVAQAAAAVKQGGAQTQIGANVIAIAKSGATAQEAAAQYSLNQALAAREIVANETVAQLQSDLYKMAIQYNQEWTMWKRQQDYAKKLAESEDKQGIKGLKNDVSRLIDEGGGIAVGAADAWRKWRDQYATMDPNDPDYVEFNITQVMAEWATANGYDPAGPEAAVFAATLREIKAKGVNTDVAWANAMNQLYSGMPSWDKWGPSAVLAGQSNIRTNALAQALALYQARKAEENGEDDSSPGGNTVWPGTNVSSTLPAPRYGG